MAFSYSGDPLNSESDALRFALGDTDSETPILQDAEIMYLLSVTADGSDAFRLAVAFRAAATALGAKLIKRSLGPQSEDATARHSYYVTQAEKYERVSKFSGSPPLPAYSATKVFDKNMMVT